MNNATVCNVNDIRGETRTILERLLGQELRDEQQVFVMAFTPGVAPDEETRRGAAARIVRTLNAAETDAVSRGIRADEADASVEEAIQHVRHRAP